MNKKYLLLQLAVNLTFALNVFFSQSFIGLGLLFTLFIVGICILLNLIYMAVNDTSIKSPSDFSFEEIPATTVTVICHEIHRVLIINIDIINKLLACVDPAQTVLFLLILHFIVLVQIIWLDVSLSAVGWTIYGLSQLAPRFYGKIEPKLRKFTARVPIFNKLMEK